jgi:FHS family L-fucose permease-like MFS transporter
MAIIGGAVLTPLMGIIADFSRNIANAYYVPLFGYICIACYSFFARRSAPACEQMPCAQECAAVAEP